jgi:antitoxin (DNA-binding transcriptional repressor) of toxin-antitoxin stability system
VVRVGRGNIVSISAINTAAAHLVPQERDNRDDHYSGYQKRWR